MLQWLPREQSMTRVGHTPGLEFQCIYALTIHLLCTHLNLIAHVMPRGTGYRLALSRNPRAVSLRAVWLVQNIVRWPLSAAAAADVWRFVFALGTALGTALMPLPVYAPVFRVRNVAFICVRPISAKARAQPPPPRFPASIKLTLFIDRHARCRTRHSHGIH